VACITYTKRAVEVIKNRLGFDDLFLVSTLHSFLWSELGRFQEDIRDALQVGRIPALIARAREKDNGGGSKQARKARAQAVELESQLSRLHLVPEFSYEDSVYSNYDRGLLSHDDVIEIAAHLFAESATFRRLIGVRFPYIFVDEAQDTFDGIVSGLNLTCAGVGLPLVGYFGDPWQQIYEGRAGSFAPPPDGITITKAENFRCAKSVVCLLNAFREDVRQYAAGDNKDRDGSVSFILVQAETPSLPRNRYDEAQIQRALRRMDQALAEWGWSEREDVVRLFLARQMIARRLGFSALHQIFTGEFASSRAQDDYEKGTHFLLKPIVDVIWPMLLAHNNGDSRSVVDLLCRESPAFAVDGPNAGKSLREMVDRSNKNLAGLRETWAKGSVREILEFCRKHDLIVVSDRLAENLRRAPRAEPYDEELHEADKGDWLCDAFFAMTAVELPTYCNFILENTAFSTQHGVKGEEYPNVLVVFDDVEAGWNNYSFTKLLTPHTAGEPTEGQRDRGRKLAYVCFSRAMENLRVLLFTTNPDAARQELIDRKLLNAQQVRNIR
jgi:DNA helicase-2/ATP-dependent DNA helicase PcrA